jgi:hypothetical protein
MVNQSVLRDQFRATIVCFEFLVHRFGFSRIYIGYLPGVVSTTLKCIWLYISRIVNVLKEGNRRQPGGYC